MWVVLAELGISYARPSNGWSGWRQHSFDRMSLPMAAFSMLLPSNLAVRRWCPSREPLWDGLSKSEARIFLHQGKDGHFLMRRNGSIDWRPSICLIWVPLYLCDSSCRVMRKIPRTGSSTCKFSTPLGFLGFLSAYVKAKKTQVIAWGFSCVLGPADFGKLLNGCVGCARATSSWTQGILDLKSFLSWNNLDTVNLAYPK